MTQINPTEIIKNNILIPSDYTKINPNGIDCSITENIVIKKNKCYNILFNELIFLPKDIFATFHTRSSLSRKGIICQTGLWDSGYQSICGCTIFNLGDNDIILEKGFRVGQFVFWRGESYKTYEGHYKNNNNIESQYNKI